MADIYQTAVSNAFSSMQVFDSNFTEALFQVMAWCWTDDQPLPESMLTQFTDVYMRHWGESR